MRNKLYRSRTDKKISGVFGGLGQHFNIDPNILRLIAAVAVLCSVGSLILIYIIASIIIPEEPAGYHDGGSYYP